MLKTKILIIMGIKIVLVAVNDVDKHGLGTK